MNYFELKDVAETSPPPIVTYDVDMDDDTVKEGLAKLLKSGFSLKRFEDLVFLYTQSIDDYEVLIKYLQFHEHGYYTYQPSWHDVKLIVLKNYLGSDSELIRDLKAKSIECLGVHAINRRQPRVVPTRLLTLKGDTNLAAVKKLRNLGIYGGHTWHEYKSDKYTPVQCSRCQRLDHDSRFCYMPSNCRNCGEQHLSKDCKYKDGDSQKCFNCNGKHPANHIRCPKWISYKENLVSASLRADKKLALTLTEPSNQVDSFMDWNLLEKRNVVSMCYDYTTASMAINYGPLPKKGELSPLTSDGSSRLFKRAIRRSTKTE